VARAVDGGPGPCKLLTAAKSKDGPRLPFRHDARSRFLSKPPAQRKQATNTPEIDHVGAAPEGGDARQVKPTSPLGVEASRFEPEPIACAFAPVLANVEHCEARGDRRRSPRRRAGSGAITASSRPADWDPTGVNQNSDPPTHFKSRNRADGTIAWT